MTPHPDRGVRDPAHPGVRFPPPFLYVAGFLGGLALERWGWRMRLTAGEWRGALLMSGWLAVLAGLCLTGWGFRAFFGARTAIMPIRPARILVRSGPYRYSRNPMYVGLSAAYLGLALLFNVVWPIVLFPLVLVALHLLVIRREERYLAVAFGEQYALYQRHVRRWL